MSKLNDVASKVAKNYAGLSGDKEAALDPNTIMVFAQLIFELITKIKECRDNAAAGVNTMKNPNLFQRLSLRLTVRNSMSARDFRKNGEHIINSLLSTGKDMTEADVLALYSEID